MPYFGDVLTTPEEANEPEPSKAPRAPSAGRAPGPRRGPPIKAFAAVFVAALCAGVLVWQPWANASTPVGLASLPAPSAPSPQPTPPAAPERLAEPTTPAGPATPTAEDLARQAEQERLAKIEQEEVERAARAEQERLAAEEAEQDRLAEEKAAQESAERLRKEKADTERERLARLEREKADTERERLARLEREKADKAARAEQERLAREKAEKEQAARVEAGRLASERAEQERLAKLPAGLSPDVVQTTLASARKSFDDCLKNPSRGLDRPLEAKRLRLRFTVQPRGNVTAPTIDDAAASSAPVGQCLRSTAATLVFPEFRGDPAQVEAPIALPSPPAPPPPAATTGGDGVNVVVFTGARSIRSGGEVGDTMFAERPGDVAITDRQFEGGVVTYVGQVGFGKGSTRAGIGLHVNISPEARPMDARRFRSVTFRLASPTTRSLRLRIIGNDRNVSRAGCYPTAIVRVSREIEEHTVKFSEFEPESACGMDARSAARTIGNLTGFEVVDVTIQKKPSQFSVGTITVNP